MPDDRLENLPPHDRRRFFRAGLARALAPLANYVEKKLPLEALRDDGKPLRPPGALPEAEFLNTCYRCGKCADACPAVAIALTRGDDPVLKGTPYINPDERACVICDDLSCMKVCPSGALKLVDRFDIRMGLAQVDHDICVRTMGHDCTVCVEKCPIASVAIRINDLGRIEVIDPRPTGRGCTGCGLCQEHCPTRPTRAIRVMPL